MAYPLFQVALFNPYPVLLPPHVLGFQELLTGQVPDLPLEQEFVVGVGQAERGATSRDA
jgi:hypothetical protein